MEIGIRQHAVLYALICKWCFLGAEEEAEELIRKITESYGKRRGERMRFLAERNKEEIGMNSFLIHSEWQGKKDENSSRTFYEKDRTVSEVTKCAWCEAWKEYGLLKYGSFYCRYIDRAICEGFDGGFDLKVSSVLSRGDPCCRFEWTAGADEASVSKEKPKPGWILPFSFHCKELFQCAQEVLCACGREEVLEEAKREFIGIFPETMELFGSGQGL